jgi:carbamoylphosphate synthase small subunit
MAKKQAKAILLLEDGTIFEGTPFGAQDSGAAKWYSIPV